MLKKYRFGFEWRGLVLFFIIMVPNFFWFAIPAPNDILRTDSHTPVTDIVATACQITFVILLCFLIRSDQKPFCITKAIKESIVATLLYYICWIIYYLGITNKAVILGLTILPCVAFLLFAVDRRNVCAIVPIIVFTVCHLLYAIVNFIAR